MQMHSLYKNSKMEYRNLMHALLVACKLRAPCVHSCVQAVAACRSTQPVRFKSCSLCADCRRRRPQNHRNLCADSTSISRVAKSAIQPRWWRLHMMSHHLFDQAHRTSRPMIKRLCVSLLSSMTIHGREPSIC